MQDNQKGMNQNSIQVKKENRNENIDQIFNKLEPYKRESSVWQLSIVTIYLSLIAIIFFSIALFAISASTMDEFYLLGFVLGLLNLLNGVIYSLTVVALRKRIVFGYKSAIVLIGGEILAILIQLGFNIAMINIMSISSLISVCRLIISVNIIRLLFSQNSLFEVKMEFLYLFIGAIIVTLLSILLSFIAQTSQI